MAERPDAFVFAHQHRDEVAWLSQNTNHLPVSPDILRAMHDSIDAHDHEYYPRNAGIDGLADLCKQDLGLDTDAWNMRLTHGALEAVYVFMRAVLKPGDEVISSDPSFLPLHHHARLCGAEVKELPIYGAPWKLTPEAVRDAITDKTRVLLLVDPINPLGTEYTRDEVKAMCDIAREHDLYLLHDITYHDFAYDPALATEFYPEKTVLAVSYSKNCGFAGARIGGIIAQPDVFGRITPYFVNNLGTNVIAQRALKVALETKNQWWPRVLEQSRANQNTIKKMVDGIDGAELAVHPSSSNTVCIDVSTHNWDPNLIEERLLFDHKVFVRGGPYLSPRFGQRFFRVSFSVPETHIARFIDAFPKVAATL